MPAIYHEGSWLGNATDPEVLVKDTVGWTGKNLLKNTASSRTINGVTFTVNSDGTIIANGTATASVFLDIPISLPIGEYVFSGTNNQSDGSPSKYYARLRKSGGIQFATSEISPLPVQSVNGSEIKFNVLQDNLDIRYQICIYPAAGAVSNLTFYPMIRRADIIDDTYEPYHESVEEEIEQIYTDNGVLGAKNLLKVTANTQTLSGVTFTVNRDSDGNVINVTVNGTASANTSFVLRTKTPLAAGKSYIMSRGEVGDADFQMVATAWNSGSYVKNIIEIGAGGYTEKSFVADYNGYNDIQISIFVRSGKTISNAKVYPMIRLASDPDDTYQPYAMTNRELTEKVNGTVDLSQTQSTTTPEMHVERTHLEQIGKLCILDFWINKVTISETNTWKTLFKVNKAPTKDQAFSILTGDGKIGRGMIDTNGLFTVNLFTALSNNSIIGQVIYFTN